MGKKDLSKKRLGRRDFLKLSGLSAASIPAILETASPLCRLPKSSETDGGFIIHRNARAVSPHKVNVSVYKRFNAKNTALGRGVWDEEVMRQLENLQQSDKEVIVANKDGFRKEDYSLLRASWSIAHSLGSNAAMHGRHEGMFQLAPLDLLPDAKDFYEMPWKRDHLTKGKITQKVIKAAKFFGASLVGITELNKRWIYSNAFDPALPEENGAITFIEADQIDIPTTEECQQSILDELLAMEDDVLKEFLITTLEGIDSEALPPGSPSPFLVGTLPANQVAQMVPMMMDIMPEIVKDAIARNLGLPFCTADIDPRLFSQARYLDDGLTLGIPKTMKWVIVLAFEMDIDAISSSPMATCAASAGNGYSRITATVSSLAEFIRMLGFNAIPCGDMTGLSIPMAIDAGLGELGRNGLLITPKYGPRVQLAKVITDIPLLTDQSISFGVAEFCQICNRCVEQCPGKAISSNSPTSAAIDISNNPGIEKWPIKAIDCMTASTALGSAFCSTCIHVCPFNRPEGWLFDVTRRLISVKNEPIDKLILNLNADYIDETQPNVDDFWESERFIHIKS